ncbi:MAG: hypothetical protein GY863_07115 [bacterium]|nr:hypothetical protein [bacterium]
MSEFRRHTGKFSMICGNILLFLALTTVSARGEIPAFFINSKILSYTFLQQDTVEVKKFDAPKWVMFRSAVMPGWGQWHNGKKLKSAAVFSVEAYFIASYFINNNRLNDIEKEYFDLLPGLTEEEINLYRSDINYYEDNRNKYAWYFAFSVIYGMIDAFVDAYLMDFNSDMDINVIKNNGNTTVTLNLNFNLGNLIHRRK